MNPKISLEEKLDKQAPAVFIMPAVLIVLFFSIFPLIVSLFIALSRLKFIKGGVQLKFIGWLNFKKLLFGSQQYHFLGKFDQLTPVGFFLLGLFILAMFFWLYRYIKSKKISFFGTIGRVVIALGLFFLVLITLINLTTPKGLPGTLVVTLIYVILGVMFQFLIGLGLALLCVKKIKGRSFFRLVFFIPMMITPVGIAYLFRMLTDMTKGPFSPIIMWFGYEEASWAVIPWGARIAVMIGDAWQWIPFMFIVLLAGLESLSTEQKEAAIMDGAGGWEIFRDITWPTLLPVSATIVLIRLIEAFKIIDLPNVMTNGGPGIATESLSLHSYFNWRTMDLSGSAAVGYLLMIVAVFVCLSFVNLFKNKVDLAQR